MQDLHFAIRQLLKHPGFTAVAALTLAVDCRSFRRNASEARLTIKKDANENKPNT